MTTYEATAASVEAYRLSEGPVWDDAAGRLLWVDIPAGRVVEGTLGDAGVAVTRTHEFAGTVGAVVPAADGALLVAARDGFATVTADGTIRCGPRVLPAGADSRYNDGACDPAGRFLAGSMALDDRRGHESLYRLAPDGSVTVLVDGLTLSNGLGWSPDGRTMYHVDSVPGVVWAQPYDPGSGRTGPRRQLFGIDDGTPDGLCVDTDGNLWVAVFGAGQVRCHTPDGRVVATVRVPAPHTTSAAFVGPGRDRLLITTGREELPAADLAAHPDSGRLFLADVGATGLPTVPWAGTATALTPSP